MVCLHRRMVQLHTHSLTYHIFARVVSRCLPCSFRLPECPFSMVGPFHLQSLSSDLTVFSQQAASGADSACPLPRRYRVTCTWSQHLGRFVI